uniref:hypothetical protein n=1 Tax=Sulfurihydrogenibium sp. TaxID=2053621 RepID=UPI0026074990
VEREDNYLRFGTLIVDKKLKPIEFRVTSKFCVGELQKIIYGETLKEALFIEKVGIHLLNSMESEYDYIFCKEKILLNLRNNFPKPVFLLEKFDEWKPKEKYSFKLISSSGKFEPVLVKYAAVDEKNISQLNKELVEIFKYSDIMEPFKRIEKAIDYIDKMGLYD